MNRTKLVSTAVVTLAATLGALVVVACGTNNTMVPDPDVPGTTTTTPATSAPAITSSSDASAACGPNDCKPCDEAKQKCMGPMVCNNHPEKAGHQCMRAADGQCKDTIVCAP